MRWADGREMTTAEKIGWWAKLFGQMGSLMLWLGLALLFAVPIMIALLK